MIARKCDRCGKYYDFYTDFRDHGNMLAFMRGSLNGMGNMNIKNAQYDLCKECMDSVIAYADCEART